MGLLSIPPHVQRHRIRPWSRQPRRPWLRADDLPGAATLFAAIPSLPRSTLACLTNRLIERMDDLDGDADVELNGDEQDDDADGRDLSWSEWHIRWTKLSPAGHEAFNGEIVRATEDDEDDDPAGGAVDDMGEADESRPDGITLDRPLYGVDQSLGPVNIDEMYDNFERAARSPHPAR